MMIMGTSAIVILAIAHNNDDLEKQNNDGDDDNPDSKEPLARCPYFIDPANNDLTGREIKDTNVKELIVQLHNEVNILLITVLDVNLRRFGAK